MTRPVIRPHTRFPTTAELRAKDIGMGYIWDPPIEALDAAQDILDHMLQEEAWDEYQVEEWKRTEALTAEDIIRICLPNFKKKGVLPCL